MTDCLACDLRDGRVPLPGGTVHETDYWVVEHCVGPLGLGTLIVKPKRHVTTVGELSHEEASELGALLAKTSSVTSMIVDAEQVYNCLWSHAGGERVHIHYVIQPVTKDQLQRFAAYGPRLQVAMFDAGELPDPDAVEAITDRARQLFAE